MKYSGFGKSAAAIAAAILMVSCDGKGDKGYDMMEFETYSFNTLAETADTVGLSTIGPSARFCRIAGMGTLPVRIGDNDVALLRDSLLSLVMVKYEERGKVQPVMYPGYNVSSLPADSTEACSYSYNALTLSHVSPYVVVWKCFGSVYPCGAAHPNYGTTFVNYSVDQGKILSLGDIMKPGYEKTLTELLRDKLSDRTDLLVPLEEIGIPASFEITDDGLNFIYGIYEIAPYSEGEVAVALNVYELSDILSDSASSIFGPNLN